MDVHSRIATLIDGFGWRRVGVGYDVSELGTYVIFYDLDVEAGIPRIGRALLMRYPDIAEATASVSVVLALLKVYSGKPIAVHAD